MKIFVHAQADPGTDELPGTPLQRIQIIKGRIDKNGATHEQVFEVAGDPESGASVDENTCKRYGQGEQSLCAVWVDPDFDPEEPAFYYSRVLENPSCRWSAYLCNEFAQDQRPETCDNLSIPKTIQERAITSPVWYEPSKGGKR